MEHPGIDRKRKDYVPGMGRRWEALRRGTLQNNYNFLNSITISRILCIFKKSCDILKTILQMMENTDNVKNSYIGVK